MIYGYLWFVMVTSVFLLLLAGYGLFLLRPPRQSAPHLETPAEQ